MRVVLAQGNITHVDTDAIVNAANPIMLGGGGVDGAIHAAAGPKLVEACRKVPTDGLGVRCPVGEARITPGFALRATHVIHTVGPVYRDHDDPAPLLASAFRSSLELAEAHGLRSVAFPAISCGAYGYPLDEAAAISLEVVHERDWDLDEVRFVLFDRRTLEAWQRAVADRQ